METALVRHRDRRHSSKIPTHSEVANAEIFRVNVPAEIPILLRAAGSLRVPAAGVTVLPGSWISELEGANCPDGSAGALWFAVADDGARYGITLRDWRELDGGRVIRVGPGDDPAQVPLRDFLPRVVIGWLERQ